MHQPKPKASSDSAGLRGMPYIIVRVYAPASTISASEAPVTSERGRSNSDPKRPPMAAPADECRSRLQARSIGESSLRISLMVDE